MSAEGYTRAPQRLIHHLMHTEFELPLVAQIYGGDEKALIQTAVDIEQKYPHFTGIELNIGCPSPQVMACGGGAGMLRDRKKALQIIKKISQSISLPFSFKTRAGLTADDKAEQFEFILEASQYVHMITIHGRTYKQSHSGDVDRNYIYEIKKNLSAAAGLGNNKVIIGNGGIKSYDQALEAKGNLDGIMIGQAAIGDPRIFTPNRPTKQEIYETSLRHLNLVVAAEIYLKQHQNFSDTFPMPTYEELINFTP